MRYLRLTLLIFLAIGALAAMVACSSSGEIRESNKNFSIERTKTATTGSNQQLSPVPGRESVTRTIKTPTPTPTPPLSAKIDAVDLQDGDCISSKIPDGITIYDVEIVECSGIWEFRVLSSFYAGSRSTETEIERLAEQKCPRQFTFILYDLDRVNPKVSCLQDSFGLSGPNSDILDRLVAIPLPGECLNDVPESGGFLVFELVSCSSYWQYEALSEVEITGWTTFPGDDEIYALAERQCHPRWNYMMAPSIETWEFGRRKIICLFER